MQRTWAKTYCMRNAREKGFIETSDNSGFQLATCCVAKWQANTLCWNWGIACGRLRIWDLATVSHRNQLQGESPLLMALWKGSNFFSDPEIVG